MAERATIVLTATVRVVLQHAGLPKKLWAEVFSTATYLRNRTMTRVLDGLTPAPCAVAEPNAKLKQLDDRARFRVFVGYKYGDGGYRV